MAHMNLSIKEETEREEELKSKAHLSSNGDEL
jgi:hypothetical protein